MQITIDSTKHYCKKREKKGGAFVLEEVINANKKPFFLVRLDEVPIRNVHCFLQSFYRLSREYDYFLIIICSPAMQPRIIRCLDYLDIRKETAVFSYLDEVPNVHYFECFELDNMFPNRAYCIENQKFTYISASALYDALKTDLQKRI